MSRNLFLVICLAFFLGACSSKQAGVYEMQETTKTAFQDVMKIKVDCSECKGYSSKKVVINGVNYRSDVPIRCCIRKNLIDINAGLKKAYIHRIIDQRDSAASIEYITNSGKTHLYDTKISLEALFYMFLTHELKSRGIMTVNTQTSPYTYRLDFAFDSFWAQYDHRVKNLNGKLSGILRISNINLNTKVNIDTKQNASQLSIKEAKDFNFFTSLLVKQAAIKVAEIISKI